MIFKEQSIKGNINKLFLIRVSKWFMLHMPIIALFYMDNGLSVGDIMLIQSIGSATIVLTEIPSGYFSDSFGRRNSILIGMGLSVVAFILLGFSYHFWAFAASIVIMGLGKSFISGTDSALLYDSLVVVKREDQYLKYEGRNYSIGTFAEAMAAIVGGWLAQYAGLRATVQVQLIIISIGFLVAWSLVEVQPKKPSKIKGWKNMSRIIRFTFLEHKSLKWFILLSAAIGSATLTMAWFAQPFFKELNIPTGWIGTLWALLNLTVAALALVAYRLKTFVKMEQLMTLIVIGILLGYLGIGWQFNFLGLAFVFLIYIVRGIATPILLDFVNQHTPSDMRATVLSLRSFAIRGFFAIIAPFMGWVTDVYSLQQAFLVAGGTFGLMGLVAVVLVRRSK